MDFAEGMVGALTRIEHLRRIAGHEATLAAGDRGWERILEASKNSGCTCGNGANCVEPDVHRPDEGLILYSQLVRQRLMEAVRGGSLGDPQVPEVDLVTQEVRIDLDYVGSFQASCNEQGWGLKVQFAKDIRNPMLLAVFWMLGQPASFVPNAREICYAFVYLLERAGIEEDKILELAAACGQPLEKEKVWLAAYGLSLLEPRTKESEVLRLTWGARLQEKFAWILEASGHKSAQALSAAIGDHVLLVQDPDTGGS